MKPTHRNPLLRHFVLAATTLLGLSSLAYSADLFWDANGETAGVGGTGNWSATAWRNGSTTGTLGAWVDGNRPVFALTAGIVTLDQNVAADGMNFTIGKTEIRGSGTNTLTFDGGTITSGSSEIDITNLLAGDVIFNPTAGTLNSASTFFIKANNTGLTSVELNAGGSAPANANMIIDDAGAFGSASSTVLLTAGILNIGALTSEAVGTGTTASGSGGGFNLNAWPTTLAGGTIRSRAGANTWNGATTLTANSGLMTRGGAGISLTFSPTATIHLDSFTLTCSSDVSSDGVKLQGDISGVGGKIATGNFNGGGGINPGGSTILSGTNTYDGGTAVNFGSLVFLNAASKPSTGNVTVAAAATLGLGVGASPTYFTGADIDSLFAGTFGATLHATSNVGLDTTAGDFAYGGSSGAVTYGLSKLGANKLTLTGNNAYTGPTNVFGGTIALSGAGTFGSGALTLNGGTVDLGEQNINIGALSVVRAATIGETITAGSLTTSGTAANSYAVSNASGNAIIAASLLANSNAGLTKTGNGTLTLSGENTYTGGTTVSAGSITFLKAASLPASGTVTVPATATVGLGVGDSPTYFTGSDVLDLLAGTLTNVSGTNAYSVGINTAAGDYTLTDNLGPSTRAIIKQGANALTLSGDNTFDKLITVSEGTLKAGSATAFNNTGNITVQTGATLDLNGFDAKLKNISTSTGTITTTGAGSGTDTLTISALNPGGIANLFTDNGTRKLVLNWTSGGGALAATTNINNTYSGGLVLGNNMRISPLTGVVGSPGAIVSGPFGRGSITVSNSGQIYFNGPNQTIVNDVIVNGAAGNGSRAGAFRVDTAGNIVSGTITASAAPATFNCGGGTGRITLTGQVTGTNGLTVGNPNGTSMLLVLNNATVNANDYAGATTNSNSTSTIALGAANQIPNGIGKGNVIINFGKLDLAGYAETINGLSGGSATTVDNLTAANTANTLTVGDGDATGLTFAGVIKNTTGTLALTKIGTGTQTLSGANEYTGTTTVTGGTLLVNGNQSLATGPVQVDATLGGTGTIGGEVTVASGGTVNPGTVGATGTLNVANSTSIAGIFACDVNAATTDLLAVTGDLTLTGSTLDINEINPATPGTYVIATYTGTRTGALGGTLPDGYSLNYDDINQTVELVVPAPAGYTSWATTNNVTEGENGDDDKDGISNLVEYALGLDPQVGNPAPGTFVGNLLTFNKGTEAKTAGDVTYIIETSTSLGADSWSTAAATEDSDSISYALPANEPGGKLFARLKVTRP